MTLKREDSGLFRQDEEDDDDDDEGILFNVELTKISERYIFGSALKSRVFVFAVGVASTMLVGPFDSSASLQLENVPDFLRCPANWDGAFNVRIATKGYEYEESHAFFPLFPYVARVLSRAFVQNWFTTNELLAAAAAGAVWNNLVFCFTAVILFKIGRTVLNNDRLAMRAALLFCWNPASIFFSVAYSESLFAFFSFLGMYLLVKSCDFQSRILATCSFALATLTRSNGAILGVYSLWAAYKALQQDSSRERYVRALVQLAVVGGIHFAALLSVLGYGWYLYCFLPPTNGSQRRPWCDHVIPNIYSFIEEHYWNVGPFSYYEAKQIPNFLLAAPAFMLSVHGLIRFATDKPRVVPPPFFIQLTVSILVGVVILHVQVFTRLVAASSPVFYWYAAELTQRKTAVSYFVYLYFAFYAMFGTAMFCSYFPWT